MLRRIEPEERAGARGAAERAQPGESIAAIAEGDVETWRLPHDHPRWVRDAVALSHRARELARRLAPVVVAVFSVWDHRLRSIVVGGRSVRVDASGCYRADF